MLADTNAVSIDFYEALILVSQAPVFEDPTVWTTIANGSGYAAERRCEAILAFFRRHVKSGSSLSDLLRTPGLTNWFSRKAVWNQSVVGGSSRLEGAKRGKCVYALRPECCNWRNGTILMSFSKYISDDDMSSYMAGTKLPDEVQVVACVIDKYEDKHYERKPGNR